MVKDYRWVFQDPPFLPNLQSVTLFLHDPPIASLTNANYDNPQIDIVVDQLKIYRLKLTQ